MSLAARPQAGRPPIHFGKYRILAELGSGGMADVFLSVDAGPAGFSKLVVVKCLRSGLAEDPEFVAMFMDEARLAARLNHPNIVQTNEVGNVENHYYLAMEYLEGQPLHRVLFRNKTAQRLTQPTQYAILLDVLSGLNHAHELVDFDGSPLNVVHRDVTPQNIFVTYAGQVKVVDFGIAKAAGRSVETRAGVVKGKVAYMAPEQASGADVDRRADVFAVGVMLWEMATNRRMWEGMEDIAILPKLFAGQIPISPRAVDPNVPDEIDRICRRALAPNRDERYASAAEMQHDLESYLRGANLAPNTRLLGKIVAELFEDKRSATKAIIEQRLAALTLGQGTVDPLSLTGDSSQKALVSVPPGPLSITTGNRPVAVSTQVSELPATPPPPKSKLPIIGALVALTALAIVAGIALGRTKTTTTAPSASIPALASAPVPSATNAPPSEVLLRFKAAPPNATFYLDRGPALPNPYEGRIARDGKTHQVVVVAPQHKSRTVDITLEQDIVLDLTLDKVAGGGGGRPYPTNTGPAHSGPGTNPGDELRVKKPTRQIDTTDPFER